MEVKALSGEEVAADRSRDLGLAIGLPQYADQHRPQRPVLLSVDQEPGEGAALRVGPELADPLGTLQD